MTSFETGIWQAAYASAAAHAEYHDLHFDSEHGLASWAMRAGDRAVIRFRDAIQARVSCQPLIEGSVQAAEFCDPAAPMAEGNGS